MLGVLGILLVNEDALGNLLVIEDALGILLVKEDALGILDVNPATPAVAAPRAPAPGNFDVNDEILGIPFGVLTNPPIPPTVFDAKLGFLTPDIIPSIPFGFGIFGVGSFGRSTFGISTFGRFGKFGFGMLGADIFGMLGTFGADGIDGTDGAGIDGADILGIEKSGIYQSSANVPPSYPGAPPPPTVKTLSLIKVGSESRNATSCSLIVLNCEA